MSTFIQSDPAYVEVDRVELKEDSNTFESCILPVSRSKSKVKPFPLSDIPDLKVQEALIIKDLTFALVGLEGCYIRYSDKYSLAEDRIKILGPDYKIAKHLDVSLKTITQQLVKYGKIYSTLELFQEIYDKIEFGRVIQRLCLYIGDYLINYRKIVCEIEESFKYSEDLTLRSIESIFSQKISISMEHLHYVITSIHEENIRRSVLRDENGDVAFSEFIESIKQDLRETGSIDLFSDNRSSGYCKGGIVLKIVQDRYNTYQGDQRSSGFLRDMLEKISKDYVISLNRWLIDGEIADPFEEFLVKKNTTLEKAKVMKEANTEKYWDELYMIRSDGIISQFISKEIQHKIIATGKYLNIFKECMHVNSLDALGEQIEEIKSLYASDMEYKIDEYYKRANKILLKLILEGYDLQGLLEELHCYFLLSDSSQIDSFIDKAVNELRKPRNNVSGYRLAKIYKESINKRAQPSEISEINKSKHGESGISQFLAQSLTLSVDVKSFYELANEILNIKSFDAEEAFRDAPDSNYFKSLIKQSLDREQITSADSNQMDTNFQKDKLDSFAIAGINLDLKLPFPLNQFITQDFVFEYQMIFKFLALVKFINKLLDISWKEINLSYVWKYPNFSPPLKKWVLRCRILHNRMKDFLNSLQTYINYEVIQPKFEELNTSSKRTALSLLKQSLGTDIKGNQKDNNSFKNLSMTNYTQNSLFDEKILKLKHSMNKTSEEVLVDVRSWIEKISSYLNDILRDSFITNEVLISNTKNLMEVIVYYNVDLNRLKKSIVLTNNELYSKFSQEFPDKFYGKDMSEEQINQRIHNLNEMLNIHFQSFNDSLTHFIETIKSFGNVENPSFLILIQSLENCFPDN